jgi:hypothetical protein
MLCYAMLCRYRLRALHALLSSGAGPLHTLDAQPVGVEEEAPP